MSTEEKKDRFLMAELRMGVALEKVTQAALLHASDEFNQEASDPGWGAELHEDMLRDAVEEAVVEIDAWRTARKEYEGR